MPNISRHQGKPLNSVSRVNKATRDRCAKIEYGDDTAPHIVGIPTHIQVFTGDGTEAEVGFAGSTATPTNAGYSYRPLPATAWPCICAAWTTPGKPLVLLARLGL